MPSSARRVKPFLGPRELFVGLEFVFICNMFQANRFGGHSVTLMFCRLNHWKQSLVRSADLVRVKYELQSYKVKNSKSYELFKKKLDILEITTPVPEEKQGAVIAALLPNDCKLKRDFKDKFFESVNVQVLASKEGLKLVKDFLDEELKEDDLEKQVRTWDEFEDCTRADQDIEDFLSNFDRAYKKAVGASSEFIIPAPVRAFMVLKRSNVTKTQRMLVMSKLDQSKPDKMFENICR